MYRIMVLHPSLCMNLVSHFENHLRIEEIPGITITEGIIPL